MHSTRRKANFRSKEVRSYSLRLKRLTRPSLLVYAIRPNLSGILEKSLFPRDYGGSYRTGEGAE